MEPQAANAERSQPGTPVRRTGFLERGGTWVVVQLLLMSAVFVAAILFREDGPGPWMLGAGSVALLLGAWFGVAGARLLGRNLTPFPKPVEGAGLIETGIYGRVRHPLYTSVMLISAGWALVWGSIWALALVLLEIPFFLAKARREEQFLREQRPGYADYAQRVPRFLPYLRSRVTRP